MDSTSSPKWPENYHGTHPPSRSSNANPWISTTTLGIGQLTGAFYVGLLDGLLGVAGMMTWLVMKWIIPENSLSKHHLASCVGHTWVSVMEFQARSSANEFKAVIGSSWRMTNPLWLAEFRPTLSDASNMEDMGALQRHQLFSAVIHALLANAALRQITVFWLDICCSIQSVNCTQLTIQSLLTFIFQPCFP